MTGKRLVRIIIDSSVAPGAFHIGGTRVVDAPDGELGRELRTTEVRVNGAKEVGTLRWQVARSDELELTEDSA